MKNYKDLSIIIVNYKSERYLKKCIASIFNCAKNINKEIIIVNNDIERYLEFQKNPEIKIIQEDKNVGFGTACNHGAKESSGEILFFLNPDAEIPESNLDYILNKFEENEEIGVIGPKLITEDGKTQIWCAGKELTFAQFIKNNLGIIESKKIWESEEEIFVDWVSGAALFIRKNLFEKIGGFDENFFMYCEDNDLCRRVRKEGYKNLYCPKVSILHSGGKSRKNIVKQKLQFFKSVLYYAKKKMKKSKI